MRNMLAFLMVTALVLAGCRSGHNPMAACSGREYEDLNKILSEIAVKRNLPYDKAMLAGLYGMDKFRRSECAGSKDGEVYPLGLYSRCDGAKDAPRGQIILRLMVSILGERKVLYYGAPHEKRKVLLSVDSNCYVIVDIKLSNMESGRERISIKQIPPSQEIFSRTLLDGEVLLVFTPSGLYSKPWYSRQFIYYCHEQVEK